MTDVKMPDLGALEETVAAVRKDPAAAKLTVAMAGEFRLNSTTGVLRQGA